jgi:hypothetical protein
MAFRIKLKEITPNRIFSAVSRRMKDIPDTLMWSLPFEKTLLNRSSLLALEGIHQGRRCFIMANGPSLANMDLSPLDREITFGLNRIYLLFEKLCFIPTYYVCVNELVLEQFSSEIQALSTHKFINWNRRNFFKAGNDSTSFVKLSLAIQDDFARNFRQPLFSGGTVTYVALQIAYIMGFSEVVLVGLDHSFAEKGTPNKVETRQAETDTNHFHPNYFPKGVKWQLPDLRRSEVAYELARQVYEKDGRTILDATVNGKCPVFEKVEFQSLF